MSKGKTIDSVLQFAETLVSDTADVYLFFSDLVGSTEYKRNLIKQNLPDIIWILRQLIFLNRTADIIKKYGGIIVKTIGDEIFAYFEATTDPSRILSSGIEIVQAFDNLKTFKGNSKIEAKVSIDFGLTYNGSIIKSEGFDPIGLPVDRCARLNSLAGKNEIVFSEDFLETLASNRPLEEIKEKYKYEIFEEELKGVGRTKFYKILAK
jgi:class 3 adenylate cyclase